MMRVDPEVKRKTLAAIIHSAIDTADTDGDLSREDGWRVANEVAKVLMDGEQHKTTAFPAGVRVDTILVPTYVLERVEETH